MAAAVTVVVPLKPLAEAKSRMAAHLDVRARGELVLAMAADTVAAAAADADRTLVVARYPAEVAALADLGAEVVADGGTADLNQAFRHGAALAREADPGCVVGALQADLPALEPGVLAAAVAESGENRAFCADRHGIGTTLLLSAPGGPLDPRFGPRSAQAHLASGAIELEQCKDTLRADVDTPEDLEHAQSLGLGRQTLRALRP